VLYEMCTLQHPFNADSLQMLALKIIQGSYPPIPEQYSEGINDLLKHMLMQDAKKRYDIDRVLLHETVFEYTRKYAPDLQLVMDREDELGLPHTEVKQATAEAAASPKKTSQLAKKATGKKPKKEEDDEEDEGDEDPEEDMKQDESPQVAPARPPPLKRRGSVFVRENLPDDEPDWDISYKGKGLSSPARSGSKVLSPPASASSSPEPSMARNTQADILRAYLEEKLGADKLAKIMTTLEDPSLDDKKKQQRIEKLTQGNQGLLPIVHTLMYLSSRSVSS